MKLYETHKNEHESLLLTLLGLSGRIGLIKLGLLPIVVAMLVFALRGGVNPLLLSFTGVALLGFILLWIYHSKIHEKIDYSQGIIEICKRHEAREQGTWVFFPDNGAEFADRDHAYSADLDIVGNKSLFQWINTTHTIHGRQRLSADLLKQEYIPNEIELRQDAVSELSDDTLQQCDMEYKFGQIGISKGDLSVELSKNNPFIANKKAKYALLSLPILTLGFVILSLIMQNYLIMAMVFTVQGIVGLIAAIKTTAYFGAVSGLPYRMAAYGEVIETLMSYKYKSKLLRSQQKILKGSLVGMKRLGRIVAAVNLRHNQILWGMLNILLLWDIFTAIRLEAWKREFAHLAADWFEALGEYEALLSLSILPNVCDLTCLPSISNDNTIAASSLGHPLIPNHKRVVNDMDLYAGIFIISGSNMSGKTTFLRTVGINMVLAKAGSYVCASEMSFPLIDIYTSMRISDDLNEGISTFYAELRRIKCIIEAASEFTVLFLIDEIFRGTNSIDRLAGARAVLDKLDKQGASGIITTHDLDLCKIADTNERILNYGFSETYANNEIHFDYKINPGMSISTNAKYLMRIIGIEA